MPVDTKQSPEPVWNEITASWFCGSVLDHNLDLWKAVVDKNSRTVHCESVKPLPERNFKPTTIGSDERGSMTPIVESREGSAILAQPARERRVREISVRLKLALSFGATIALSGTLAAFGGWTLVAVTIALGHDSVMTGLGGRIFGGLFAVFCGGISLAALVGYGVILREIWS